MDQVFDDLQSLDGEQQFYLEACGSEGKGARRGRYDYHYQAQWHHGGTLTNIDRITYPTGFHFVIFSNEATKDSTLLSLELFFISLCF